MTMLSEVAGKVLLRGSCTISQASVVLVVELVRASHCNISRAHWLVLGHQTAEEHLRPDFELTDGFSWMKGGLSGELMSIM
jgi:hypothetical protein